MLNATQLIGLDSRAFDYDSADFDGTNDLLARGAGLTGAADGKVFTCSFWFRLDGSDGAEQSFLCAAPSVGSGVTIFELFRGTDNKFSIAGANSTPTVILFVSTSGTYTAGATWHHFYASVDMANAGGSFIYIDDADTAASATVFTNDNFDFTVGEWTIGSIGDGTLKVNACIAEFWFDTVFLNASTTANRRKFRSAAGKPMPLGPRGTYPTGAVPLIYQHLAKGEGPNNFAQNRGSGGGFTVGGALTIGSTAP